jgi:hypothetical protein
MVLVSEFAFDNVEESHMRGNHVKMSEAYLALRADLFFQTLLRRVVAASFVATHLTRVAT